MSDNIIDKPLFDTMEKIEHFLNGIPQFVRLTGVERCKRLLEYLGNPQDKLKIIHVAGTNGKGSVCSYINGILNFNGYKTGFFTSPHLVDIRERIRICNQLVLVHTHTLQLQKSNQNMQYQYLLFLTLMKPYTLY